MKALFFDKELVLRDIDDPVRQSGEALIRVITAGICNTDMEITRGYMGFTGVPGHEFVGIVEESGNAGLTGKRVVGEINAGCGECSECKGGDPRHCEQRTVLGIYKKDGVFAEYITLPEKNLYIVPDSVSNNEAVFTEPLAAALQIFDENNFDIRKETAVIGDGKLGLLVVFAAAARGYKPVLIGKNTEKMRKTECLGIKCYDTNGDIPNKFDLVIECSGNSSGFSKALEIINPRGTIVLKSTYADTGGLDLSMVVVNEITVKGSRCGRFPPALELLSGKMFNTKTLISRTFPLTDGLSAFNYAAEPDSLKVLLTISNG